MPPPPAPAHCSSVPRPTPPNPAPIARVFKFETCSFSRLNMLTSGGRGRGCTPPIVLQKLAGPAPKVTAASRRRQRANGRGCPPAPPLRRPRAATELGPPGHPGPPEYHFRCRAFAISLGLETGALIY